MKNLLKETVVILSTIGIAYALMYATCYAFLGIALLLR